MANITPEKRLELSGRAVQIRDAVQDGENTQYRVGSLLEEIVEYLGGSGSGPQPTPVELEGILASLNGKDNPSSSEANRILEWDGSKWNYIPTPTGGSGGGITLNQVWDSLAANDGTSNYHQIHPSHLLNVLADYVSNTKLKSTENLYTWWGRRMVEDQTTHKLSVSGDMTGVGSITFTNNVRIVPEDYKTLRIEDATGNSVAHIYATGGVSALGNSSSGGDTPTPGGSELHYLLQFVNSYDSYSSDINPNNIEDGSTLRWNGDNWIIDKTAFDDIAWKNVSGNSGYLKKTVTLGEASYEWAPAGSSTVTLDYLYNIGDVGTDSGYTNTIATGHILQYGNSKWNNVAFGINAGTANSILSSITLGSNTYSLPQANGNAMGIVKAGTGLSASSGTLNHSNSVTAVASVGLYKLKYDAQGHITGTSSITKADITNLGIPGQDTNTTYSAGNGLNPLNGGTEFSVKAASGGGLAVDITGIKIDPNTNKRVLWGNDDKLTNDIGSDITFDYGRGIQAYTTSNNTNAVTLLRLSHNSDNTHELDLGYGSTVSYGVTTQIYGVDVDFFTADVDSNGNVVKNAQNNTVVSHTASFLRGGGLAIGNGVLKWDSVNNALYVQKIDGTAANFYATGGVSALGFSNGTSSIDAMTFGVVDITSSLKFKLGNTNNKATIHTDTGTSLLIDNPYGGIFINDSATYINDAAGDTYFGGDENTDGGNIYICLASQGYEYYRLDVDKLHRDGYLTLD